MPRRACQKPQGKQHPILLARKKESTFSAVALAAALLVIYPKFGEAHFLELIPSQVTVSDPASATIELDIAFTHPFLGGPDMMMDDPESLTVTVGNQTNDITGLALPYPKENSVTYRASYRLGEPGDHVFGTAIKPYWEPSEGKMIIHYAKVVVDAFGDGTGWDTMIGQPVEIEPLTRPYGLWAGTTFTGQVLKAGKPIGDAIIEIEYRAEGTKEAPNPTLETQVMKTDRQGNFTVALPFPGWWGIAALVDGDNEMQNPEGNTVPVELGGIIWIKTEAIAKPEITGEGK